MKTHPALTPQVPPSKAPFCSRYSAESIQCGYYKLFMQSREAMFLTSREGYFLEVNDAMASLLGYTKQEIIGLKVDLIYDVKKDRELYIKYIEENGTAENYEITLKTANGENIFCLIDAIILKENDKIIGYYGIIRTRFQIVKLFQEYFNKLNDECGLTKDFHKRHIHDERLLLRYGSAELIDYFTKTGRNPLVSGRRKVTVLFFDIIGSTAIAERIPPELFSTFLTDIFTDIMDLIYGNKGSVNKLLGDGIMATFGLPMETGQDALNAVTTARQIIDYLNTFNDVRPEYLDNEIKCGIGIATGFVFAGVVGSIRWEEYTVLGDTVNVAARIEKVTRKIEGNILMDENTYAEVKSHFTQCTAYKCSVRGKKEKMRLYSL